MGFFSKLFENDPWEDCGGEKRIKDSNAAVWAQPQINKKTGERRNKIVRAQPYRDTGRTPYWQQQEGVEIIPRDL